MDGGLVGYSPRGRKESDTTERLHLLTYLLMTNNVEHLFHVLICHLLLSFTFLSVDSGPPGSGPLKDLNKPLTNNNNKRWNTICW